MEEGMERERERGIRGERQAFNTEQTINGARGRRERGVEEDLS